MFLLQCCVEIQIFKALFSLSNINRTTWTFHPFDNTCCCDFMKDFMVYYLQVHWVWQVRTLWTVTTAGKYFGSIGQPGRSVRWFSSITLYQSVSHTVYPFWLWWSLSSNESLQTSTSLFQSLLVVVSVVDGCCISLPH